MGWLSFLKSRDFDPAVFERDLSLLAKKITQTERNVTKYQHQQKSLRNLLILYGSIGYLFSLIYIAYTTGLHANNLKWVHINLMISIPIVAFVFFRIIKILNAIRISRALHRIEQLRSQHEEKIDQLKEKTKFSSTQALLQRFSDGTDLSAQVDEELREKQRQLEEMKLSLQPGVFKAYPTQSKSWFDSIIEAVMGSDELNPSNRFALICANCSSHNGLAPPGQEPQFVRYVCPRCGFINGDSGVSKVEETTKSENELQASDEKSILQTNI